MPTIADFNKEVEDLQSLAAYQTFLRTEPTKLARFDHGEYPTIQACVANHFAPLYDLFSQFNDLDNELNQISHDITTLDVDRDKLIKQFEKESNGKSADPMYLNTIQININRIEQQISALENKQSALKDAARAIDRQIKPNLLAVKATAQSYYQASRVLAEKDYHACADLNQDLLYAKFYTYLAPLNEYHITLHADHIKLKQYLATGKQAEAETFLTERAEILGIDATPAAFEHYKKDFEANRLEIKKTFENGRYSTAFNAAKETLRSINKSPQADLFQYEIYCLSHELEKLQARLRPYLVPPKEKPAIQSQEKNTSKLAQFNQALADALKEGEQRYQQTMPHKSRLHFATSMPLEQQPQLQTAINLLEKMRLDLSDVKVKLEQTNFYESMREQRELLIMEARSLIQAQATKGLSKKEERELSVKFKTTHYKLKENLSGYYGDYSELFIATDLNQNHQKLINSCLQVYSHFERFNHVVRAPDKLQDCIEALNNAYPQLHHGITSLLAEDLNQNAYALRALSVMRYHLTQLHKAASNSLSLLAPFVRQLPEASPIIFFGHTQQQLTRALETNASTSGASTSRSSPMSGAS